MNQKLYLWRPNNTLLRQEKVEDFIGFISEPSLQLCISRKSIVDQRIGQIHTEITYEKNKCKCQLNE